MKPYYESGGITIYHGDCRELMAEMEPNSVDAIVTDPPYGLEFMGKEWDKLGGAGIGSTKEDFDTFALQRGGSLPFGGGGHRVAYGKRPGPEMQTWHQEWAEAVYRVAKPGAHLLAFGGTRTHHRLMCAIEDAGWEIRDCLMWLYGSGFPKSLDVGKAIDKAAGVEREHTGTIGKCGMATAAENYEGNEKWSGIRRDVPATDAARQWDGWGTALKPAFEIIVLARKPLTGTVAGNVQEHGTGAINVDACRIEGLSWGSRPAIKMTSKGKKGGGFGQTSWEPIPGQTNVDKGFGRWPANVVLDEEAAAMLDEQSGELGNSREGKGSATSIWGASGQKHKLGYGDGCHCGASRFFKVVDWQQDELLFSRATAIFQAWNPDFVSTVESDSNLSSEAAVSVLSRAVTVASHGDKQLSDVMELGTTVTRSELRTLCVNVIAAILSSANGQSSDLPPEKPIQCPKPVSSAATLGPTDTMTTTIDRVKSSGSAVVVTFVDTQPSTEVGAADYKSRFRYCAKASRSERNTGDADNDHPTVKPLSLMQWLCTLVTPPGGLILDPFMGSGTTILAAHELNFRAVGIDLEEKHCEIAVNRLSQGVLDLGG